VILRGNLKAAKEWQANSTGSKAKANSFAHTAREVSFETLDDIASALQQLRESPFEFIVRGNLNENAQARLAGGATIRRLLKDHNDGTAATLEDAPKSWVCLDIDDVKTPYNALERTADAIDWLIEKHMPYLRGVGMVYKLSGSAGHPSKDPFGLRVHIYALLDDPRTCAQLRAWRRSLSGIGCDPALFSANQIHYTADPITNGIGKRPAIITTVQGDLLHIPKIDAPQKPVKRVLEPHIEARITSAVAAGAFATPADETGAQRKLAQAVAIISQTSAGGRNRTLFKQSAQVYNHVAAGALNKHEADAQLTSAALSSGLDLGEIQGTLNSAYSNARPAAYDDDALYSVLSGASDCAALPTIKTRAQAWGAIQHAKECQTRFNDALADWKERFSTAANAIGADATRDLIRDSGKAALVGAEPVAEDFLDTLARGAGYFEALRKAARGILLEYPTLDDAFASVTAHESIDDATALYLRELVKSDHDRRTRNLSKLIDLSDETRGSDDYTLISDFDDVTNYRSGVLAVRAGMGTGKTRIVASAYREVANDTNRQFLALTHRAALCAELARVLNCVSYSDVKAEKTKGRTDADIYAFFACCVNSINRPDILANVKQPPVIVIDEISQFRKAFAGIYDRDVGTAGQATPAAVYDRFIELLRGADTVVCLDAGLSEIDLDWLRSIRPDVSVYEHVTRSGDGLRVTLKWSKKMHVKIGAFDEIAARLYGGENIWVSVGERAIGDALLEHVGKKYKHIWLHANTPTTLKNKILDDVDGQSKDVQLFIASPTISSGISVTHADDPHFDAVYVIGNGSGAGADDLIQMLRRVRYATDLNLVTWQVDRDVGTSDAALLHDVGQTVSSNDPLYTLRQQINAQRNAGRADFKYTMALALTNAGFDVVPEKMGGNLRELGALNKELRKSKALRLNSARDLSPAGYHELKNGRYKTEQDFDAIAAYELRDRLNLSEVQAITDDDVKLYADGHCRDALARVAAVHGIALDTRENTHTLVKLYAIIFEGVEIRDLFNEWGLLVLEPGMCKRIAKNAIRCGREGVAFEVLPQNYRRKGVQINNPVRTVRKILEYAGILSSNDTFSIYKRVSLLDSSKRDNVYISDTPPAYLDLKNKAFSLVGISFDTDSAKDRVTQRRVHERHFPIVSSNDTFLYADVSSNDTFLSGGVSTNDTFYNKTRPATAQPIEVRLKNCPPYAPIL
jgi:putative DNA primase/helicase